VNYLRVTRFDRAVEWAQWAQRGTSDDLRVAPVASADNVDALDIPRTMRSPATSRAV